jgi:hypothetical protein
MNSYLAFHKGTRIEVQAENSLEAQTKAAQQLKVKKSWQVTIVLVELNGNLIMDRRTLDLIA